MSFTFKHKLMFILNASWVTLSTYIKFPQTWACFKNTNSNSHKFNIEHIWVDVFYIYLIHDINWIFEGRKLLLLMSDHAPVYVASWYMHIIILIMTGLFMLPILVVPLAPVYRAADPRPGGDGEERRTGETHTLLGPTPGRSRKRSIHRNYSSPSCFKTTPMEQRKIGLLLQVVWE